MGLGTFTLLQLAPFGMINRLRVTDQDGNQLGSYTGYELVLLHNVLGRNSPFGNVQYNDGSNGWVEVGSATVLATTEELKGVLHLPIRIGRAKNVSKLNFEVTFASLNSTTGMNGVGTYNTSWTSGTGTLRASPVYDDGIVETWSSHLFTESAIGTAFAVFKDPPRGKKIRYALVVLPDYWTAQNVTSKFSLETFYTYLLELVEQKTFLN